AVSRAARACPSSIGISPTTSSALPASCRAFSAGCGTAPPTTPTPPRCLTACPSSAATPGCSRCARAPEAMRHAGADALSRLSPLLDRLRASDCLRERSPGVFYRKGRAFVHFHEDPAGLFADLRGAGDFDRFPVNSARERNAFLVEALRRSSAC